MVGFVTQTKRLLKIKWKQPGAREKENMSNVQKISIMSQAPGSRFDNGREFTEQENIQYILPKDIQELDRLHQQHWMLKVAFQGNFEAPVEEGLKKGITVLDSGCGPGTWMLDMAEAFPNSHFHGIDMAAVFPEQIKPANCEFRLGNLNEKLPYPDNYFDYIHQGHLVAGLTAEGWKNALAELFRVLKPGGWIELKEAQVAFDNAGPLGKTFTQIWQQFLKPRGLLPEVACDLGSFLENIGCEDVNVTKLSIPVNHGGILGTLFWSDLREVFRAMKSLFVAADPITFGDESFEKTMEEVAAEFVEYGTVGNWYDVYGRKPLA